MTNDLTKSTENKISYEEAVSYLYSLQKYGINFGLSKTANLLKAFGNPHGRMKFIHVAGTNGKGSVAAMLESILMRSGLKVALYTSPHLVRFTERFRINGQEIEPEEVAALVAELRDVIHPTEPPTFFEVTTAMALLHFSRQKPDVSIMEVGMGGRLDATNVIRPMVAAITNISLEHQAFLGPRLSDIAREKAGIIKRGVDLVTAAIQPEVVNLFRATCEAKKAPFWRVGKDVRYRRHGSKFHYFGFRRVEKDLELGLFGRHQFRNAALALAVIEVMEKKGFAVSSDSIREGLRRARWVGRMQVVSKEPLTILDGAHNPGAMRTLAGSLMEAFPGRRLILVLGIMGDKDIAKIMREIVPLADRVIFTRPEYYRAATPETLMQGAGRLKKRGQIVTPISEALETAKRLAGPRDMVLVTGSLFTVGEAMAALDPEQYKPDNLR
jgi:dihydrofolate synthase/folylpolyglutamate synthase